jgi:succinyl-CoA synthetase alpha subunit
MNTVDALSIHGGHCANFLDTGGKATSETVKSSFRIITSDPRVKAIFVNIFGGLTRCDMIAEGIILAFRDLNMSVPVVVRLRGTNEESGQKMVYPPSYAWRCLILTNDSRLLRAALLCMLSTALRMQLRR